MNLLLVDGSNLVMRAALGGELPPAQAVPTATGLVRRAAAACGATHLVLALDVPGTASWRRQRLPQYKANRTRDTGPWFIEAHTQWSRLHWYVEGVEAFEADDVIATLALRAQGRAGIFVASGDSDLLPLTAHGVTVLKPGNGGTFTPLCAADVCARYQIAAPERLRDLKALMGESGDNIPGVPGIGPARAAKLLAEFKTLAGVLDAAKSPGPNRDLLKVAQHRAAAELAYEVVGLRTDAPVLPVKPSDCRYE